MSYLLDTNILSELRRKCPNDGVVTWMAQRPASSLYLSVLTLGEIRKGVECLSDANRRAVLIDWLETELPAFFTGRILAVDHPVADHWGRMVAATGRSVPAIDSLIAATAAHHGLSLVTRNVRDFSDFGLDVINPWNNP
ncbi:MAG: type II toxin-antitoxin system VapC family toxin [Pseudomonadota bacterium]